MLFLELQEYLRVVFPVFGWHKHPVLLLLMSLFSFVDAIKRQ